MAIIIAIVGASGSGKSTLVNSMAQKYSANIICEDYYYKTQSHLPMEQRVKTNYDHPNAFDHQLLQQHLEELKAGIAIDAPQYSYIEHDRLGVTKKIEPSDVIFVEGITLLTDSNLLPLFDHSIYLDVPQEICLLRRINRDVIERERTLECITEQYLTTVWPMYKQFVEPSKYKAQYIVASTEQASILIEPILAKNTSKNN